MKTVTITQKLAEEILDQLEGAQKDCYVQSTENVISDLKQALRIHDVVGQSEQLKCDNCKCTPTVIHNTPSGRFCEACRPITL